MDICGCSDPITNGRSSVTKDLKVSNAIFTHDLYASGNVHAAYFYGDGSNISNITSGFVQPLANLVVSNTVTTTNLAVSGTAYVIGNTGIGTAAPDYLLDVAGYMRTVGIVDSTLSVGTPGQFLTESGSGLLWSSDGGSLINIQSTSITQPFANLVVSNTVTTTNMTTNVLTVAEYQNIILPGNSWKSIASGNGVFVAVNASTTAAYSTDFGQTWNTSTLPSGGSTTTWNYVFYAAGTNIFVALGNADQFAFSNDLGVSWASRTLNDVQNWTSGCYTRVGNYVVVGGSGRISNYVDDVEGTWSSSNLPSERAWYSVAAGNRNECMAVGYGNGGAFSDDGGANWVDIDLGINSLWLSICFGDDCFVAVGGYGNQSIRTLDNGSNWTQGTLPVTQYWKSVCVSPTGLFVTVGNSNIGAWSNDKGETWHSTTLPYNTQWESVSYGDGYFVAVNLTNRFVALSTDNGLTWTSLSNTPPPVTLCGPTKTALVDISRTDSTTTGYYALQVSDNTNSVVDTQDNLNPFAMTVLTRDEWSPGSPQDLYHLEFVNRTTVSGYGDRFNYGVGFGFYPSTSYGAQPFLITPHTNPNDNNGFSGPDALNNPPALSLLTDGSGWVGVAGIINPTCALDVNGNIKAQNIVLNATEPSYDVYSKTALSNLIYASQVNDNGLNFTGMTLAPGNVTTSPIALNVITRDNYDTIPLENINGPAPLYHLELVANCLSAGTATGMGFGFQDNMGGNPNFIITPHVGGIFDDTEGNFTGLTPSLTFFTDATRSIQTGGNLGVNYTPACALEVNLNASYGAGEIISEFRTGGGATAFQICDHNSDGFAHIASAFDFAIQSAGSLDFWVNGATTPSMRIASNGRVGIGTTSPGATLDVNGTINASTSITTPLANITTLNVSSLETVNLLRAANIYSANALTTTNIFSNTLTSSNIFSNIQNITSAISNYSVIPSTVTSIAYGNASYVAVTPSTTGAYSIDGRTWTTTTLPNSSWASVAYGASYFVAVSSTTSAPPIYSTNGTTWSSGTISSAGVLYSVTYGAVSGTPYFVAVGTYGGAAARAYSTNGITWTIGATGGPGAYSAVTYGGSYFVAVSQSNQVAWSTNATSWSYGANLPSSRYWSSVAYGGSYFVAISRQGGASAYTTNPTTSWTAKSLPSTQYWISVAYGNGRFVAVSQSTAGVAGTAAAYTTNPSVGWNASTLPSSQVWQTVIYDGTFFIAAGGGYEALSIDGITWYLTGSIPTMLTFSAPPAAAGNLIQYSNPFGGSFSVNTVGTVAATTANVSNLTVAGVGSDLIPSIDNFYGLGTSSYRWKSLSLGPGTLFMTDTALGTPAGITVTNGQLLTNNIAALVTGNLVLIDTVTQVPTNLTVQNGTLLLNNVQSIRTGNVNFIDSVLGTAATMNVVSKVLTFSNVSSVNANAVIYSDGLTQTNAYIKPTAKVYPTSPTISSLDIDLSTSNAFIHCHCNGQLTLSVSNATPAKQVQVFAYWGGGGSNFIVTGGGWNTIANNGSNPYYVTKTFCVITTTSMDSTISNVFMVINNF